METYADMTFEEVMEAFADTVTRLAYLRMGNEQDAKDIFQTVFLKLYTQTMEFHDVQHVKAWLIQTTIHACVDEHRKFWRRHRIQLDEAFAQVEDDRQRRELYELMELVPNHRNVLYLYYYEGYSIREISIFMNARENTVKSWMRRGKEELRRLLGGEKDA
ncbi:RNA polymerase sigma factor [[Clostridium] innocuum]|nr:RNA polymerase sigma factor [[Clostridium] innocuum]